MSKNISLPIAWYVDDYIAQREINHLSGKEPIYVGHQLMVPNINDFHVLERENHSKILFHNEDFYSLISNVCRHHEALMLSSRGNTQKIICPVHRWSYNTEGVLLNAPRFAEKPCLNLDRHELTAFHGLLFMGDEAPPFNLHQEVVDTINSSNYQFSKVVTQTYPFNWKIFMEVYLDNYHIPVVHPGLSKLVDVENQQWLIEENHSAQFVRLKADFTRFGTKKYELYQSLIKEHWGANVLVQDIMWLALYPNIMIEKYPFALVISSLEPTAADECINIVEYYLDQEIVKKYPDFPAIFTNAYAETAAEDAEICELIFQGRKALYGNGKTQSEHDPHHPLMEKGLPSFYNFMYQKFGDPSLFNW